MKNEASDNIEREKGGGGGGFVLAANEVRFTLLLDCLRALVGVMSKCKKMDL